MSNTASALVKTELTQEELQAVLKMRNRRTQSYNLRMSEKEMVYMDTLQKEVEASGQKFESRTDFVIHCAQAVATVIKSQTKLTL